MSGHIEFVKQTFTLPIELDDKFRKYCKENDLTFSQTIRKGIRLILELERIKR